jgi:hypothetical protein
VSEAHAHQDIDDAIAMGLDAFALNVSVALPCLEAVVDIPIADILKPPSSTLHSLAYSVTPNTEVSSSSLVWISGQLVMLSMRMALT